SGDSPGDATGSGSSDEESTDAGEDSTLDPTDVIAEVSYPMATTRDLSGTITMGVHALTVEGSTMLLELYFTAETDDPSQSWNLFRAHGSPIVVTLSDPVNLKQYTGLENGEDNWRSSAASALTEPVPSGATVAWWGYFAAPQDDIDSIDVTLNGGPSVLTIPIER
ncbi:MAG: hypothetical protein ACK5H2_14210, partial [Beutenbergiaceae bacterium]